MVNSQKRDVSLPSHLLMVLGDACEMVFLAPRRGASHRLRTAALKKLAPLLVLSRASQGPWEVFHSYLEPWFAHLLTGDEQSSSASSVMLRKQQTATSRVDSGILFLAGTGSLSLKWHVLLSQLLLYLPRVQILGLAKLQWVSCPALPCSLRAVTPCCHLYVPDLLLWVEYTW